MKVSVSDDKCLRFEHMGDVLEIAIYEYWDFKRLAEGIIPIMEHIKEKEQE